MCLFRQRGADTAGIAEVMQATGLSRSSLYATFGGKQRLHVAALRRYLERRSRPVFDALAADGRGLPAITGFFEQLVAARCTGAACPLGVAWSYRECGERVRVLRGRALHACAQGAGAR
ncbi:TetR/AcrR family transcriptional regulator [Nonomuraea sp. NPDC004186]